MLVAGRVVQGFGAGAISAVAYVAVARGYAPADRPHMIALLSSAWVAPGLIGPALAGVVADHLSWRWVFLGLAPQAAAAALAWPALRKLRGREASDGAAAGEMPGGEVHSMLAALALATGAAALLSGSASARRCRPCCSSLPAVPRRAGAAPAGAGRHLARAARSAGRHRGHGAAQRRLLRRRGVSAAAADRDPRPLGDGRRPGAHGGHRVLDCRRLDSGAAGTDAEPAHHGSRRSTPHCGGNRRHGGRALGARPGCRGRPRLGRRGARDRAWPLRPRRWSYSRWRRPGREGAASASMQLANVLGVALGTGFGGAIVALGTSAGRPSPLAIGIVDLVAIAMAAFALAAARGLRTD